MQNVVERTSDGMLAGRVGQIVYALMEGSGGFRLMSTYSEKPVAELSRSDFYGYGPECGGEAEFMAHLDEMREHQRQRAELGRTEGPGGARTPWGKSQGFTTYADGLYLHHTAGHGGFRVYAKLNREIPEPYRNADGWYEEDCEYAKVVVSLPAYFTEWERKSAEKTVRNWFPDEWEAVNGKELPEGASFKKDERLFQQRHADDWVVIAALGYETDDGSKMVCCTATKGGRRSGWYDGKEIEVETVDFAVPAEEYTTRGRYGFVIDPERHERIEQAAAGMVP